jgi:hypothetical protein
LPFKCNLQRYTEVGRCTLTPPDPQLKGAWYPGDFNPCSYQAKNPGSQNSPFKMQPLHRYTEEIAAAVEKGVKEAAAAAREKVATTVELCVDVNASHWSAMYREPMT